MKRTPIRRRTPLRARRRPKRKPPRRRPPGYDDPDYLAWLRGQDCRVAVALGTYRGCRWPIHAAHVGERGLGQKCPDSQAISMCSYCHLQDSHDHATRGGELGFIASMSREQRRAWYDEQVAKQRAQYLAERGML
ncbi:MAG: hypothetical protein ACYTAN_13795 [Planctomycetota bacterium]